MRFLSIAVRTFPTACVRPCSRAHLLPPPCARPCCHTYPPPYRACPLYPCARPFAGLHAFPTLVRTPLQMCTPSRQLYVPSYYRTRPPCSRTHLASTNVLIFYCYICGLIVAGRTRYRRRRGPSYLHFITHGFVSWDSFVGSLYETASMV
jgi:hypothetical protein